MMKNKPVFPSSLLFAAVLMLFCLPAPPPQRSPILRKQTS